MKRGRERRNRWPLAALLAVALAVPVLAGGARAKGKVKEPTLRNVPPVVVRTVPEAGAADVAPGKAEIRVTFSKKMKRDGWSWVAVTGDSWPTLRGQPRFLEDGRTCVVPVLLRPGKTYAVWINSDRYGNFQDRHGRSAVPYLLVFRTARR